MNYNRIKHQNLLTGNNIMNKLNDTSNAMHFAIKNIIRYGDTDIFPYPIERQIFKDKTNEIIELLVMMKSDFENFLNIMPISSEKLLTAVSYNGFRQGTQIDSIWNCYLLGMVLSIGNDIEKSRLDSNKNIVFSYRFKPNDEDYMIFDKNYGWLSFQKHSIELAKKYKFVLTCDISDFYPRIYHHRLENALKRATDNTSAIHDIKFILNRLSDGVSYGLPVGGPASRLLSELLLNRTDRLLMSNNIIFCRFVDDYHIFGNSKEEIFGNLIFLNEILLNNEGLSIQKNKTRILTSSEFLDTSTFSDINQNGEQEEQEKKEFLKIHIHYDPYSATAEEDYKELTEELGKFDVVGMLASEMQKTHIQEGLTKKLLKAIIHLNEKAKNIAVSSLLENFNVLYPVFPTVMLLLKNIVNNLNVELQKKVFNKIRDLINSESFICKVPINLAYAIRVLAKDNSEETENILNTIFSATDSLIIKRDIILIRAEQNADYWISDLLKKYITFSLWEKRSLLIASYILEDEGKEWRKRFKETLSPFDKIVLQWASEQKKNGVPLEVE